VKHPIKELLCKCIAVTSLEKTLDSVAVSQKEKNSGNQTVAEKNF